MSLRPARPLTSRRALAPIKVRVAYRYSNDGVTWDNPVALYANGTNEQTNDGAVYGNFADISTNQKLFIQWGFQAINSSGTAVEMAMASMKIDKRL